MNFAMRFAAVAALLVLAGCAGTSQDAKMLAAPLPPAAAPDYKVGDEFLFKVGGTIEDLHKVVAVEPDVVVMESRVFGTIRQQKLFSNPPSWTGGSFTGESSVKMAKGAMDSLFPLKVGNKARASGVMTSMGYTFDVDLTCSVLRAENIAVLAGRFDTLVVDCDYSHSRGSFRYVYWYAPSVGHWVAASRNGRYQELASWKRAS